MKVTKINIGNLETEVHINKNILDGEPIEFDLSRIEITWHFQDIDVDALRSVLETPYARFSREFLQYLESQGYHENTVFQCEYAMSNASEKVIEHLNSLSLAQAKDIQHTVDTLVAIYKELTD